MADGVKVEMKNKKKIMSELDKMKEKSEKVTKRTISDCKSRLKKPVADAVRKHYGVDAKTVKEAGPRVSWAQDSTMTMQGIYVDGVRLEWEGRRLTPTHFGMRPTATNPKGLSDRHLIVRGPKRDILAPLRIPNPYTVTAQIMAGSRKPFSGNVYLQHAGKGGAGKVIPFKRKDDGKIEAIHTVSVPQMIENEAREDVEQAIQEVVSKRLQHNINQIM